MISSHLRRFFATASKFNSFGQAKGASVTALQKDEIKDLIKKNHLKGWRYVIASFFNFSLYLEIGHWIHFPRS
jgi:hypothetical protein